MVAVLAELAHSSVMAINANTVAGRNKRVAVAFTALSLDRFIEANGPRLTADPSAELGVDVATNTIHATTAIATEWATARSYMKGL